MDTINNLHYVDHGVYRSGIITEKNFYALRDIGISSIISMKTDAIENEVEKNLAKSANMLYINHPINLLIKNDKNIIKFHNILYLTTVLPKPILIHCSRGSDRTGIAIAMFQMLHNDWDYKTAINEMDALGFNPLFNLWKVFLRDFSEVNNVLY